MVELVENRSSLVRTTLGRIRDSHLFGDEVKARHDGMVGLVETMLKLHKDLPKAETRSGRLVR